MMDQKFTHREYEKYMELIQDIIKDHMRKKEFIERAKKVANLSFEDWIKFQNGEIKI